MPTLETVVVETAAKTSKSVIWLHGLGADGHDFEPIVPELGLEREPGVRFVFPHAPVRPVTINNGMVMRAWFDILGLDRAGPQDEAGIDRSVAAVEGLIAAEIDGGRSAADIVLAGFSQGGVIALHTALRYPLGLAGVLALSTYLPLSDRLIAAASGANREVPIFLAHGRMDPVLPFDLGTHARDVLTASGYSPQWHEYAMAHQVCMEELRDVGQWLRGVLAPARAR